MSADAVNKDLKTVLRRLRLSPLLDTLPQRLAHALGHIACRHGHSVLALRADRMLKTLKHARLTNSHEVELRKFLAVDLMIVDDFGLDAMDSQESRDAHEIFTERHRVGSMILT